MNRVLVTGGAGFLGSHLCDCLINKGNDVICVDNLFTGSKDNIRHLLGNPYFEFIRHASAIDNWGNDTAWEKLYIWKNCSNSR